AGAGDAPCSRSDGSEGSSNVADYAGGYRCLAKDSGDINNQPAARPCASEAVTIGLNSPELTTIPNKTTGAIGDTLTDTATLTKATSDAGGKISFYLFKPGDNCSDLTTAVYKSTDVQVSGNATYNSSDGTAGGSNVTDQAGIYHWLAKYSGDNNNDPAASTCASKAVDISPNTTSLTTDAGGPFRLTDGEASLT